MRISPLYIVGCCLVMHASALAQDAIIQRTTTAPVIDGVAEPLWLGATPHRSDEFMLAVDQPLEGPGDLDVLWRAVWDSNNLYVLVQATDDVIIADNINAWEDDSVEIYIDAQNTDAADYRPPGFDIPAYQLTALAGFDPAEAANLRGAAQTTSAFVTGTNSYNGADDTTRFPQGADASFSTLTGNSWTFEASFPWTALEDTPANILTRGGFGFGVAFNDDDTDSGRDSQIMWATSNGDLWFNASEFPTVALTNIPIGDFVEGDVNGDMVADQLDFQIIRANFKRTGATLATGDLTGEGTVDEKDFRAWKNAASGLAGAAVPEPSTGALLLALCAAQGVYVACRQHRVRCLS